MTGKAVPSALVEYVRLFNAGSYWASHEVLEAEWHRTRSDFYHGLILLASAFVHRERKNQHGVRAQLQKAEPLLRHYEPGYLGVNVGELLKTAAALTMESRERPAIRLDPTLVQGDEPELSLTA